MGLLLPFILFLPILSNFVGAKKYKWTERIFIFLFPIIVFVLTIMSFSIENSFNFILWKYETLFSISLRLDGLSGLIATTVSIIAVIVTKYSERYLEDDPFKDDFKTDLSWMISSVLLMILSSNLIVLFFSWVSTSYFLHQLLTHFSERQAAVKAANQKFWISRLGDLFLLAATISIGYTFNTLEFISIFEKLKDAVFVNDQIILINVAALLLVLGAMTKSAQFPFHFWLPNTMETPTPVSAIMHAGIINAGGYLVIRMSPLLTHAKYSLALLALVGGFTAVFGTIIMFSQNSIKKQLAYSTISQMGFMMLQCGIGAFPMATIHIVGHSFYKAYAFLSSATATDFGRIHRYFPKEQSKNGIWKPFISLIIFSSLVLITYTRLKGEFPENGKLILLSILSLALSQIALNSSNLLRSFKTILTISIIYFILANLADQLLLNIIETRFTLDGTLGNTISFFIIIFFITLYLFQNYLNFISQTEIGKKIYVNGLRGKLW